MTNKHTQIVVAFDFTRSSQPAMQRAIAVAARVPTNLLHFVCVLEPHSTVPLVPRDGRVDYEYAAQVQTVLASEIEQQLRVAGVRDRVQFFVHVRIGKPAAEILALAREVGADQVIIGSKGLRGVEHLVLGSVAEKVAREAECSVEIARAKTYDHVDLLNMVEVVREPRSYVPPHRYAYEDRRVQLRPREWPLY